MLPDDVAIRTSNHHGTTLQQLHDLWGAWIESCDGTEDFLSPAMLDAGDDFQASTYAALTGFYRLSVSALRSALEIMTIAAWLKLADRKADYRAWRNGEKTLSFGQACDGLISATAGLHKALRRSVKDSLFDQRTPSAEGGFARRIYGGMSEFAHSKPGYSDGDLRQSNGPIYIRLAFEHVSWIQFETVGLCFVLLLLTRPKAKLPAPLLELFEDTKRLRSRVTRESFHLLHTH